MVVAIKKQAKYLSRARDRVFESLTIETRYNTRKEGEDASWMQPFCADQMSWRLIEGVQEGRKTGR